MRGAHEGYCAYEDIKAWIVATYGWRICRHSLIQTKTKFITVQNIRIIRS